MGHGGIGFSNMGVSHDHSLSLQNSGTNTHKLILFYRNAYSSSDANYGKTYIEEFSYTSSSLSSVNVTEMEGARDINNSGYHSCSLFGRN